MFYYLASTATAAVIVLIGTHYLIKEHNNHTTRCNPHSINKKGSFRTRNKDLRLSLRRIEEEINIVVSSKVASLRAAVACLKVAPTSNFESKFKEIVEIISRVLEQLDSIITSRIINEDDQLLHQSIDNKKTDLLKSINQLDLHTQQIMIQAYSASKSKKKSLTQKCQEYLKEVESLKVKYDVEKRIKRVDSKYSELNDIDNNKVDDI